MVQSYQAWLEAAVLELNQLTTIWMRNRQRNYCVLDLLQKVLRQYQVGGLRGDLGDTRPGTCGPGSEGESSGLELTAPQGGMELPLVGQCGTTNRVKSYNDNILKYIQGDRPSHVLMLLLLS